MSYQTLSNSISGVRNDTHYTIAQKLYSGLDNGGSESGLSELITRLHDLNSLYDRTLNMQTCLSDLYNEAETYGIVKPRFMNPNSTEDILSCMQAAYVQKSLNLLADPPVDERCPPPIKISLKAKVKAKINGSVHG